MHLSSPPVSKTRQKIFTHYQIYNAYQRAGTPDNITSAFCQADIYTILQEDKFIAAFDIKYARCVRENQHESYEMPPSMKTMIKISSVE